MPKPGSKSLIDIFFIIASQFRRRCWRLDTIITQRKFSAHAEYLLGHANACYHIMIASQWSDRYHNFMNKAHLKTLEAIFSQPTPSTLEWRRIESLFVALGAQTIEGSGSRVRFVLNGIIATFHRPHPAKEAKPYQVRDARAFLESAGVKQ